MNVFDLADCIDLFSLLDRKPHSSLDTVMSSTETLISSYYDAFNRGDMQTFLGLLDEHVVPHGNQGGHEEGEALFQPL
jgi:hypothetical protein